MKLVFFDIECASVNKYSAKICAFGYVVCDGRFNILEKDEILVNPKGGFHLTDRKGEKGIILPYEYAEFKKHPPFPAVYGKIKNLLENEDNAVFGHAVLNDVKYLNLETKRFKLPSFRFSFSDSQLMFMSFVNDFSHQFGLEHIANELGVEFVPHRAVDDAFATMRVLQAMCRKRGMTVEELKDNLLVKDGKISDYNIVRPTSGGFNIYNAEKRAAKEQRAQARCKFYNRLTKKRVKKQGKLAGKCFTFSRAIEDDIDVSIPLLDKIYEKGGKYAQKLPKTGYFIAADNDDSARARSACEANGITVISLRELGGMLND